MNSSALGHPNYQNTFFLFLQCKGRNGVLAQRHKDHHHPQGVTISTWTLPLRATPLVLEPLPPLFTWLRPSRKVLWDFFQPFLYFMHFSAIFVPLLNSHHTHSSFITSPPYEVLVIAPHVTLLHCNNLQPYHFPPLCH